MARSKPAEGRTISWAELAAAVQKAAKLGRRVARQDDPADPRVFGAFLHALAVVDELITDTSWRFEVFGGVGATDPRTGRESWRLFVSGVGTRYQPAALADLLQWPQWRGALLREPALDHAVREWFGTISNRADLVVLPWEPFDLEERDREGEGYGWVWVRIAGDGAAVKTAKGFT